MKTMLREAQKNPEKAANFLLVLVLLSAVMVSLLLLNFH